MVQVAQMLERFRLPSYVVAFDEQGYDDLNHIRAIAVEGGGDFERFVCHVGLKPGHAAKVKSWCRSLPAAMAR